MGSVKEGHFIENIFGAQLLDYAYQCIAYHDGKKGQVPVGFGEYQQGGQYGEYKIKVCKNIGCKYFRDGTAPGYVGAVCEALCHTLGDV